MRICFTGICDARDMTRGELEELAEDHGLEVIRRIRKGSPAPDYVVMSRADTIKARADGAHLSYADFFERLEAGAL